MTKSLVFAVSLVVGCASSVESSETQLTRAQLMAEYKKTAEFLDRLICVCFESPKQMARAADLLSGPDADTQAALQETAELLYESQITAFRWLLATFSHYDDMLKRLEEKNDRPSYLGAASAVRVERSRWARLYNQAALSFNLAQKCPPDLPTHIPVPAPPSFWTVALTHISLGVIVVISFLALLLGLLLLYPLSCLVLLSAADF